MAYSHCTGMGAEQLEGTGPGAIGPNILHRNVHTCPTHREKPLPIVCYCASPIPSTCPGHVLRAV